MRNTHSHGRVWGFPRGRLGSICLRVQPAQLAGTPSSGTASRRQIRTSTYFYFWPFAPSLRLLFTFSVRPLHSSVTHGDLNLIQHVFVIRLCLNRAHMDRI